MDLRYAQAFAEAAASLHFGKAAKKLTIAPSALTRQIRLFEDSIGESLFVRSNRKVILTPKGKELLEVLKPILSNQENQPSRLRIGGLAGVIDNHFWSAAKDLVDSNNVKLSVIESTSTPALERLLSGEIDIAFVNEKLPHEMVQYFPLGKEQLALIAKQRVNFKELERLLWIYTGRGSRLRSLSKKESKKQIQVSSVNEVLNLVEMGLGVGIVPISDKLYKRDFIVLSLPIKNRQTFLAILKYRKTPSIIQKIINNILKQEVL